MNTLSETIEGEVFTANFSKVHNGWMVDYNGHDHVLIPYSRIFQINGIEYMATGIYEALRLGIILINSNFAAWSAFEASHPELNP
jgi:hypothetical protein